MMRTTRTIALVAACSAAVTMGCATGVDRTGSSTLTLKVATIDGDVDTTGQLAGVTAFLDALEAESGGAIEVNLETDYGDGVAEAESDLVRAVADGEVDLAWPATRAFAAAGIDGLRSIEAPMLIANHDAERALIEGEAPSLIADRLDEEGMVALGLLMGPLRRPFAVDAPLLRPEDWSGVRFRVFNSPMQVQSVASLSGRPVPAGVDWSDRLRAGELDGAEIDVRQYRHLGMTTEAPWVAADVVLWPKMLVLAINRDRLESMSDEQRGWIESATRTAVDASLAADYDETAAVRELCELDVRFVRGDEASIAALRERTAPVLDELAGDPDEAELLAAVRAAAAQHPDAYVPPIPDGCDDPEALASTIEDRAAALPPDGRYRVEVTQDEVLAAGLSTEPGYPGTWTLDLRDGEYAFRCQVISDPRHDCGNGELPADQVLEAGRLVANGADVVTFVYDQDVHSQYVACPKDCYSVQDVTAGWRLDGDALVFGDVDGEMPVNGLLVIEPWARIGDAAPPR
ncbi:TRAP transporter substrate-binding protein [Agromyces sp. M3QZ16-3]|uniref:TRAP transporter substrate-binding protein n=1 Tax=Agromyces sp. M3QZ16-3 TaxID=3447585 RepID=UPI003F693C8F